MHNKSYQHIYLDYPIKPTPRYGWGKEPNPYLYKIINDHRKEYKSTLKKFIKHKKNFIKIPAENPVNQSQPFWNNPSIPGLDTVSLYSFLCINEPKIFLEIGSGYSTTFARRAIQDYKLSTKIISIDPCPRALIDSICDSVVREALEDIDLKIFNKLEAKDILFIDNSHRCFMNSDVTIVFLDILPRLKSGVLVEFHDIFLPSDYPPGWIEQFYSEQYLLASYILAKGKTFKIILPNNFVHDDPELSHVLDPIWDEPAMKSVGRHGGSFWIEIK